MTHPAGIDVVIVTWNAGPILEECLRSLVRRLAEAGCTPGRDASIVVVDNASTPAAQVPADLEAIVDLIRNPENRGFAAACNQGARRGHAPAVLFLNPDVVLGPGAVDSCLKVLDSRESDRVGIVGIQLRDGNGAIARTCARRPRPARFLAALLRLPHLGGGRLQGHLMTDWDHATSRAVDHVTGACYLVRRPLFEALQGFDERFFVYFEDLDFSVRARDAGWRIWYLADVSGVHRGGWATGEGRRTRLYHDWRSRVAFARKHFGAPTAAVVLSVTAVVDPLLRLSSGLRRRSWTEVADLVAVCGSLIRGRAPHRRDGLAG